jgi:predicted esterase
MKSITKDLGLVLVLVFCGITAAADVPWKMNEQERSDARATAPRMRAAMAKKVTGDRPDAAALAKLQAGIRKLRADLARLPQDAYGLPPADVEIWERAASLPVDNEEWRLPELIPHIERCLQWGEAIAQRFQQNPDLFGRLRGAFVLGYRSSVDRTAQFYAVKLPRNFDPARAQPYRLNVFLHGRSGWKIEPYWLVEAMAGSFMAGEDPPEGTPETSAPLSEDETIVIQPFARYNIGYRDASEAEVWEAIQDASRRFRIDPDRIVLSGFSLGGGGTMRVGMRSPGQFAGISPLAMAIFAYAEAEKGPDYSAPFAPLSPEQVEQTLQAMSDTGALAVNGKRLPILMGVGTKDRLSAHHRNFEKLFDDAEVGFESYYVGGVGHNGGAVQTDSYRRFIRSNRRDADPTGVHFATLHLAHSERAWVRIEGMKHHYKRAEVHATADPAAGRITIQTQGIARLSIQPGAKLIPKSGKTDVVLDGQALTAPTLQSGPAVFELAGGTWRIAGEDQALRKRPGLTGPVSDAFTKPFLCVRPTGTPWNEGVGKWSVLQLEALQKRWLGTERGVLPVKDDRDVTEDDARRYHLVLFGDPGSNRFLAELLPKMKTLGIEWNRDTVRFGSRAFPAETHAPVFVYPNPDSPERYVVANGLLPVRRVRRSGSTRQTTMEPPIGDFAVINIAAGTGWKEALALGGFFDEAWNLEIK